ncbi:AMP-binding protein [Mameliella sediminis]|uniref:AMP-binding protein n=1 Tax=Mameliella sediminis TaxID=2836866 RepID=UPI001C48DBA5|nr:AMP-binding protein [Mameliella sediminis]MBV7392967.1 AMP-binding protein [Mameliella sediminis]
MTDLARRFSAVAAEQGARPALVAPGASISFAELERRAAAFAATCARRGIAKGDRILVAMPVGVDLYVALAACWRLGAVAVFPEPALGLAGLRHAIAVTRPRALFASGLYRLIRFLPALWCARRLAPGQRDRGHVDSVNLTPEDPALISFTSGSTGAPKAIPRSHGFLTAQYQAVAPLLASDGAENDLVAFPVFALVNLAEGRPSVLPNWKLTRPEAVTPAALAGWIRQTGATRALLPPALCETLAQADLPRALHSVFTGGGPVKPALVDRLRSRNPGLRVISVYGSTEAEPIADLNWDEVSAADRMAMAGGGGLLAGPPVAGTDLRIVEDEIQVAGPHVNAHYLDPRHEEGTKVHEGNRTWHRTGDAGRLDEQGRLWLLGRHSGVAQGRDGPLYPFAVELAAESWPGVRRAALLPTQAGPVLVYEGTAEACAERARALGIDRVQRVAAIPLDRRHRSKVDYTELRRQVERATG